MHGSVTAYWEGVKRWTGEEHLKLGGKQPELAALCY
jgi:hypothetical protein